MSDPPPPVDIRLHLRDGRVIPVDARYVGEQDGVHVWEIVTRISMFDLEKITVAELPGRTEIRMPGDG